jgi:hypothetical protein
MVMVVTVLAYSFNRSPQRVPRSHAVWCLHPGWDVSLPMQHTSDVDVVRAFGVERKVRMRVSGLKRRPGRFNA